MGFWGPKAASVGVKNRALKRVTRDCCQSTWVFVLGTTSQMEVKLASELWIALEF